MVKSLEKLLHSFFLDYFFYFLNYVSVITYLQAVSSSLIKDYSLSSVDISDLVKTLVNLIILL